MRVAIAGAGAVGRSIAHALTITRNQVLLIEHRRSNFDPELVPEADWMFADACELEVLQRAEVDTCDVVIGASGDDKVNLVFAMLCKTELSVPRVVARVNDPSNAWMFTERGEISHVLQASLVPTELPTMSRRVVTRPPCGRRNSSSRRAPAASPSRRRRPR